MYIFISVLCFVNEEKKCFCTKKQQIFNENQSRLGITFCIEQPHSFLQILCIIVDYQIINTLIFISIRKLVKKNANT